MSRFTSVEDMLADARSRLLRITPLAAAALLDHGARLVDIRPEWQRSADGEVPGSLVVERNHLEWRLHPASDARLGMARPSQQWIVLCTDGYTSSLAADSLNSLGIPATDVVGGFTAWRAAGLATVAGATPADQVVSGRGPASW